jgi:RimJ/RimL family protein N-acetyltransferase
MNTPDWEFVYGEDDAVCRWMESIIGNDVHFYGYVAIGLRRNGEFLAGVLFDKFTKRECNIHIASKIGARWATEEAIRRAFTYAFKNLRRERVTAETPVSNKKARKFNEHIGFIQEGVKRLSADTGEDAIVYGMLREQCRWIGGF